MNPRYFDRDLSWLAFNERVLQEAGNHSLPMLERLRFLAIYSSNLDEFYRVRVAHHRSLMALKQKTQDKYAIDSAKIVELIKATVQEQQQEFGRIYRNELLPGLRDNNVFLVRASDLYGRHRDFISAYFEEKVHPLLKPMPVQLEKEPPFMEDSAVYFAIRLLNTNGDHEHYLLELPYSEAGRFVVVPDQHRQLVMQLDDVMRYCMASLFPGRDIIDCYAVKISRDAELYLNDEFGGDIVDRITKSLAKRLTGVPSRFLFDEEMPWNFRKFLQKALQLNKSDMVAGGRYHNFSDFFGFPDPGNKSLVFEPQPTLPHPILTGKTDFFDLVSQQDVLLHFPYQSYQYVVDFLEQAAADPAVKEIGITLYRVAKDSAICKALEKAVKNGVSVTVFDEVQARFDEASNIYWGKRLKKAGANVRYSYENLKVHCKLFVILREEAGKIVRYAYLGTGNFNEKTAKIYADHAVLTSDPEICAEVGQVFDYLENRSLKQSFKHLLVAPFGLRVGFLALIEREIKNARAGKAASMILKMNSLQDPEMIDKLYEASQAGVRIQGIIRGICCLVPGAKGLSENIHITSIVDRYLEHARVFIFHNRGKEEMYVASADWMTRNLRGRVEVAFPIRNPDHVAEMRRIINLQLADNTKTRIINQSQTNTMKRPSATNPVRAQYATYEMLREKVEHLNAVRSAE